MTKRLTVGTIVLGTVGFVAGAVLGNEPVRFGGQLLVPMGAVTYASTAERDYAAHDDGLVVRAPANLRLLPWARFERFAVTEEAVVLEQPAPWRPDVTCDRADVDDPDAVRAALARYLPEARAESGTHD